MLAHNPAQREQTQSHSCSGSSLIPVSLVKTLVEDLCTNPFSPNVRALLHPGHRLHSFYPGVDPCPPSPQALFYGVGRTAVSTAGPSSGRAWLCRRMGYQVARVGSTRRSAPGWSPGCIVGVHRTGGAASLVRCSWRGATQRCRRTRWRNHPGGHHAVPEGPAGGDWRQQR